MFGNPMKSKYPNRCMNRYCDESIRIGDEIAYVSSKEVYHWRCRPAALMTSTDPRAEGQAGYFFCDLETGGLDAEGCAIVQIAAIAATNNLVILDSFKTLISPPSHLALTEKAIEVHGYTREKLQGEPSEEEALRAFIEWSQPYTTFRFAGFKCDYDLGFLAAAYKRKNIDPRLYLLPPWDLLKDAQRKLGKTTPNHKLVTVAKHFGHNQDGAHDALVDLYMTVLVARDLEAMEDKCA